MGMGSERGKGEPSACTAQRAKACQCLGLLICTEAMKTPGYPKGMSCTAAVWDIVSVQLEGFQQPCKSSPVWGCCLGLSPHGEGAAIKPYRVQFLPMVSS